MKILYWVTTVIGALMIGASGFAHITHQAQMVTAMKSLGYPEYMMTILGSFKILGAIALLVPGFPLIKEWAYAGCAFLLVGAAWSHAANGQPPVGPLVVMAFLGASYYLYRRLNGTASSPAARLAT